MQRANEAIIRERYPIPTVDEVLQSLNQSTVFSKLDLKWGYHQLELHPDSRSITTFTTHRGLHQYKRLMFGITSAPEVYQHVIQQSLQGCEGVANITDDIIIYGKNTEEHDRRLESEVERQNKSLLKRMKIAQAEGKEWKKEIRKYLVACRSTPHTTTGVSPAELLFGRKMRTKLPELKEESTESEMRDKDGEMKAKAKRYVDKKRNAQESDLAPGDQVLVRQERKNKLSTPFAPEPYDVVTKTGNSVVVESPEGVQLM